MLLFSSDVYSLPFLFLYSHFLPSHFSSYCIDGGLITDYDYSSIFRWFIFVIVKHETFL